MICLNCENERFAPGEAEIKQEFRGETLMVKTPVVICQDCGWQTVGNDQIDELRKRTADVYRKKHNLLTSLQIKAMREALGMSQRAFATFLRVGEASVKRWETWLVQDASSDELIRVKCVLAKKAEIIKRVTNVLLQHLTNPSPTTDWLHVVHQTQPLLASLGRYLQLAAPGSQHKITVNLRVPERGSAWDPGTQLAHPRWGVHQSAPTSAGYVYAPPTAVLPSVARERFTFQPELSPPSRVSSHLLKTG